MRRLFIALPLAADIQNRISHIQAGVPGARWVSPENMHITVSFLGDVSEMSVESLHQALRTLRVERFPLVLGGIGHFGTRRRIHTLWLNVDGGEPLDRLHDKIHRAARSVGLEPDARKFQPHVTLARLHDAPLNRITTYMSDHGLFRTSPLTADRFTLFQSTPGHRSAHYGALNSYPLQETP